MGCRRWVLYCTVRKDEPQRLKSDQTNRKGRSDDHTAFAADARDLETSHKSLLHSWGYRRGPLC